MKRKNKKFQKKGSNSLNKLSLFQKTDGRFSKKCPLSSKNPPITVKLCHQKSLQFLLTNKKN